MAVLCCTEAFSYHEPNGVPRTLRPGDLVDDNDPAVKKAPQYFEAVESNVHRATDRREGKPVEGVIEQATAAPGEKRAVSVPEEPAVLVEPPRGGPGSGREAWAAYAETRGVEVTDDMTREEIMEAVDG